MEKKATKSTFEVVGVKPGIITSPKFGEVDLSKLDLFTEDLKEKLAQEKNFPYLVKK